MVTLVFAALVSILFRLKQAGSHASGSWELPVSRQLWAVAIDCGLAVLAFCPLASITTHLLFRAQAPMFDATAAGCVIATFNIIQPSLLRRIWFWRSAEETLFRFTISVVSLLVLFFGAALACYQFFPESIPLHPAWRVTEFSLFIVLYAAVYVALAISPLSPWLVRNCFLAACRSGYGKRAAMAALAELRLTCERYKTADDPDREERLQIAQYFLECAEISARSFDWRGSLHSSRSGLQQSGRYLLPLWREGQLEARP